MPDKRDLRVAYRWKTINHEKHLLRAKRLRRYAPVRAISGGRVQPIGASEEAPR